MTQKLMAIFTENLLVIRKQAEQTAQNIEQIKDNLDSGRQELRRIVEEYDAKRIELFLEELRAHEMTWCTRCSEALSEDKAELILLEGRTQYSCGYENSCYGFRDFSNLHRVCPVCLNKANNRHGWVGDYDTFVKDQEKFYAFRVEKRDDGYYAYKFGNWIKLENEKYKLPGPSSELVERLAEEWNLPPRIELHSQIYGNDKLVVHERVLAPVHERVVVAEVV